MARVLHKKATCVRFDGLAPAYGQAAWARSLASRVFEIMILRIETSINNVFLDRKHALGVADFASMEPAALAWPPARSNYQQARALGPSLRVAGANRASGADCPEAAGAGGADLSSDRRARKRLQPLLRPGDFGYAGRV